MVDAAFGKALERVQAMLNSGARSDLRTKFRIQTVPHWKAKSSRKGRDKRLAILRLLVLKGAYPAQQGGRRLGVATATAQAIGRRQASACKHPAKKRAGSSYERLQDALAASVAFVAPLLEAHPPKDEKLGYRDAPERFQALQTDMPLAEHRESLALVEINSIHAPNLKCPIFWPIRTKTDRFQRLWLILQARATVRVENKWQVTVLIVFAERQANVASEQAKTVRMLLQAGADLEAVDLTGWTPLSRVVHEGGSAEVAALLSEGANVHVPGFLGFSVTIRAPLLLVAATKPKIFHLLLDHCADPTGRSEAGLTVAEYLSAEIARIDSVDAADAIRLTPQPVPKPFSFSGLAPPPAPANA